MSERAISKKLHIAWSRSFEENRYMAIKDARTWETVESVDTAVMVVYFPLLDGMTMKNQYQ